MKCLILAAGYATRLYPLTENFPKPLLKVGDKAILDWLIDDIDGAGLVDEYIVISNHKFARHFEEWAATKAQKVTVVDDGTSTNETRLGAVRDIQFAIDLLHLDDDMLVIAGDNLLDFSLQRFVRYAHEKQTSCIMRFWEKDEQRLLKCGVVTVDENDRILRMTEKSPTPETERHRKRLWRRCPRQLHRLALHPDLRSCNGNARPTLRHRQPAELRTGAEGLSGHRVTRQSIFCQVFSKHRLF